MTDAGAAAPQLPGASSGSPLPTNPLVTPWPAQAVNPAAPCTPPTIRPGTAQILSSRLTAGGDQPLVIDPWAPCHLYLNNTINNELLRSDNSGRSYAPILQGGTTNLLLGPVATPSPGAVAVFDQQGSHAIGESSDYGAHWEQKGTDLPVVPPPGTSCVACVQAVSWAPSNPAVVYAALGQNGAETIYRSADGGNTWALAGSPGPTYTDSSNLPSRITIDPRDPNHLYIVIGVKAVVDTLFESRDGGASWRPLNVPRNDAPTAVVVSATGALFVAYGAADETSALPVGAPQLLMSVDDGAQWSTVKVPVAAVSAWAVGLDPNDGSLGMFAGVAEDASRGWLLVLADTHDGFRSIDSVRTLVLRNPAPSAPCPSGDACAINVLPDRLGDFYVDVVAGDGSTTAEKGAELLVAVHAPLAALADGTAVASPTPSGSAGTSAGQPPASGVPGTTVPGQLVRSCQLPDYAGQTNAAGSPVSSGSLTYDGQSLLYSDPADDGNQPNTALIRKFDPSTCAPTGVIVVQFSPADLLQAQDPSYPPVEIGEMTYDARRQVLWVELRDAYHSGAHPGAWSSGRAGLFTVKVTDPAPQPVEHAIARLAIATGCSTSIDEWLAYDFTSDSLLTCDVNAPQTATPAADGEFVVHKLSAADGHVIPSCLDSFRPQTATSNPLVGWTVTRPGEVYAESEDDKTMVAIEIPESAAQACSFGTVYEHAADIEPAAEDEQLACDSQTFSAGNTTTTVAWIRNTGHTAFSYHVPGGRCPLPTFTSYLSPHSVPLRGMTSFCASTVVHFLEGYKVLPAGLPVTFSAGSQQLGVGYTGGGPDACTPQMVNPLPLGASVVTASFPGTDAYLPSSGSGTVVSTAGTLAAPNPPVAAVYAPGPLAPPGTPVQSGPVSQAQLGEQAQSQAQAEAQAQSQAQAQSHTAAQAQPGLMTQRQRRTQVALQDQPQAANTSYQASGIRRRQQSPAGAVAAGLLMLGLGLTALRPRPALARARRRRPRA